MSEQPVASNSETVGNDVAPLGEYGELLCPMPDCREALYLVHEASVPLSSDSTAETVQPQFAVTTSWRVECCAGHVLLLPPRQHDESAEFTSDCDVCNDPNELGGEVPHHNDTQRLRAVLATIGQMKVN